MGQHATNVLSAAQEKTQESVSHFMDGCYCFEMLLRVLLQALKAEPIPLPELFQPSQYSDRELGRLTRQSFKLSSATGEAVYKKQIKVHITVMPLVVENEKKAE